MKNSILSNKHALLPYKTTIDGKEISIDFNLHFTMIDQKVCNAVSSTTSAQRSYLCGETLKEFNKIDEMLSKDIVVENIRFGLSTLHALIRFFECYLHIPYKLGIGKLKVSTDKEMENVNTRKSEIQETFRKQFGLIVDSPKPGFGSTNDGNTARRFFANSTVSAAITGNDKNLIDRFHMILQVLSSEHKVSFPKFQEYAEKTARLYVGLYS